MQRFWRWFRARPVEADDGTEQDQRRRDLDQREQQLTHRVDALEELALALKEKNGDAR